MASLNCCARLTESNDSPNRTSGVEASSSWDPTRAGAASAGGIGGGKTFSLMRGGFFAERADAEQRSAASHPSRLEIRNTHGTRRASWRVQHATRVRSNAFEQQTALKAYSTPDRPQPKRRSDERGDRSASSVPARVDVELSRPDRPTGFSDLQAAGSSRWGLDCLAATASDSDRTRIPRISAYEIDRWSGCRGRADRRRCVMRRR